MSGSGVDNNIDAPISGQIVQAGEIHGDVHFHQSTDASVPRQLPGTARHFVNRAVEQDALTTLLNGARPEGVVLLSTIDGVAGVGKSALVVHWAHQMRDKFPDGELYVNLRGFDPSAEPMSPSDALASFLAALDVPTERIPADLDARAAKFRSLLHGKRMLLLLDNAHTAEQVRSLLPGSSSSLVLVTSRNRLDDLVIREGAARVALNILTPEEGRELVTRYLGRERVETEPDAVNALVELCAGLPLALGIVAVHAVKEADAPLSELMHELQDEQQWLDALETGGTSGVRAVFSWSYRSLSDGAARLFRLLGLPTGPDIGLDAATELLGTRRRDTRALLGELVEENLLEQPSPGRYRFHDLLRAYASERAELDEPAEERDAALRRLFDHYLRTSLGAENLVVGHSRQFTPDMPEAEASPLHFETSPPALDWWHVELANLTAAVRQAHDTGMDVHSWQLAHTLLYPLRLRGNTENWIATLTTALDAARQLGDDEAQAHLLLSLGIAHFQRGEHGSAAEHQERSLSLFDERGDRYWTATLLVALGEVYTILRRHEDSRSVLNRALEMHRTDGDPFGQGVARAALGALHSETGEFDEAFGQLRQALSFYRDVDEKYGEGVVLHDLAGAYLGAGRLDDAGETYRQAVDHRREIGHHHGEADSLRALATALERAGDPAGARECQHQAVALLDALGDPEADTLRRALET